ncbi:TIGR01777 family protein [Flavobacteriales bacterium 33_180_T64]|nr:TIGR01777 family protein [Flavobacteriales bacterium 33_180_T64]
MGNILITGATGLIGQEIVKICHDQNLIVHYLTTSKNKITTEENYKGFYWNPSHNEIDERCFHGVSTIINLVGATISKRWTTAYKKEIISSRTEAVKLLRATIEIHKFPVKQFVSASAIGVYPDSITNYYEENETKLSYSFLGEVVKQWETAVDAFLSLGIKVAKIRIGLVLSKKGGALPQIAKPIRFGVGAAFGTGEQWQSWIHVDDLARLFVFVVTKNLDGVYNAVSPNPVTNRELIKTVAKILHKPLMLPNIPKFVMKFVLGEMHVLLFESQRVSAAKVENTGFYFEYHHLEPALLELFD